MTSIAATSGPTAMWYLTRSTGTVALLLLTLSVVLGVISFRRFTTPGWPRFVTDALHRNVSLVVMVLLALHILTSVIDGFAPISLIDAVIPFSAAYRPLWLGLGALSFDMLVAITITSVLRRRFGHRAWRVTHNLAYASWPFALLHTVGSGSDVKSAWLLALSASCVLAVVIAIVVRVAAECELKPGRNAAALAVTAVGVLAFVVWLPSGPLGKGWARRAGTPVKLLAAQNGATGGSSASGAVGAASATSLDGAFAARLTGTINEGASSQPGLVALGLDLRLSGPGGRTLAILIDGQPQVGGGVAMTDSQVTLGTTSHPALYSGRIVSLSGSRIAASVSRGDGRTLALDASLAIDNSANTASGTLRATPTGAR